MSLQISDPSTGGAAVQKSVDTAVPAAFLSPDVAEWIRTYSFEALDRRRRGKEMLGVLGTNHASSGEAAEWCELVECEYRIQATRSLAPLVINSLGKKIEVIQTAGPRRITGLFRTSVSDSFVVCKSDLAVVEQLLPDCRRILLSKPHDDGSLTIRVFQAENNELWVQSAELKLPGTGVANVRTGERTSTKFFGMKAAVARVPPFVWIFIIGGIAGALAGFAVSYYESLSSPATAPVSPPVKQGRKTEAPSPAEAKIPAPASSAALAPKPRNPVRERQSEARPSRPATVRLATFVAPPVLAKRTQRAEEVALHDPPDLEPTKKTQFDIAVTRFEPPRAPPVPPANPAPVQSKSPPANAILPESNPVPVNGGLYVAPRPLTKILPSTRYFGEALYHGPTEIDIRVVIDPSGQVRNASIAGAVSRDNEMLAKQALKAARLWTFVPASRESKPIASEYIIQFRFH